MRPLTRAYAGVLFICLSVDYRVLFTPMSEEVVRDGMAFYTTFLQSPPAIKVRLPVLPSPPAVRPLSLRACIC